MSSRSSGVTVGRLVAERPRRSRVFEALGIDYCCGGNRPLGEVCAEKGLDAATVLRMLEAYGLEAGGEEGRDWSGATVGQLTDHIVGVHHGYLREALPRLDAMVNKVTGAHGERHPELRELRRVFGALKPDLEAHLREEEEVVFPACRRLEEAGVGPGSGHRGTDEASVEALMKDHEETGAALYRMRELTGDFEPPADACNTYRAMLDGLAELERDVKMHVHEENNVLFPKVRAAEAGLPASGGRS